MKEAQQAAMNLEGIPRYDHIFIIMLENKATSVDQELGVRAAINAYLRAGNQFTSYYATGNPSEPNRIGVGGGDDFGITDDSAWNCVPAGDTADAVEDTLPPGFAPCTQRDEPQHEEAEPVHRDDRRGHDVADVQRVDESRPRLAVRTASTDATIVAPDHLYDQKRRGRRGHRHAGPDAAHARQPVHDQAQRHVSFQDVRSAPEFVSSNRTMGGGQWDEAMRRSPTDAGRLGRRSAGHRPADAATSAT